MPPRRLLDLAVLFLLLPALFYASLAQFSGGSPIVYLLLQVPIFLLLTLISFLFLNIFTKDTYMRALVAASIAMMAFAIGIDAYRLVSESSVYPLLLVLRTIGILLAGIVVSRFNSNPGRNEGIVIHS